MKRFTETTQWDKEWFQNLPAAYKLLWKYINDRCDHAGVWRTNFRQAAFQIGESFTEAEALSYFKGRMVILEPGKWLLPDFISFQWGALSTHCRPHQKVFRDIEGHGLTIERIESERAKAKAT